MTPLAVFLTGLLYLGQVGGVDWKERAKDTSWSWPDVEPSLFQSTLTTTPDYEIVLDRQSYYEFHVRVLYNNKCLIEFPANAHTVFGITRNILIYTQFPDAGSGCEVIAFDLKAKKQLWSTRFDPVGPTTHSAYSNKVSLAIGDPIEIHGWESHGTYLEYLSLKDGKVLGERIFTEGWH